MLPLYLARMEDLGRGDVVQVDCAACHHVALLTPDFLLRLGLSPSAKVLDLKSRACEATTDRSRFGRSGTRHIERDAGVTSNSVAFPATSISAVAIASSSGA